MSKRRRMELNQPVQVVWYLLLGGQCGAIGQDWQDPRVLLESGRNFNADRIVWFEDS